MDVLLITGPAGVGKSTVAYELSRQLERRGIAHALIDTDELDRIYPAPPDLYRVTEESLSAVWGVLHRYGARRLILVGVYLDLPRERDWIRRAVPHADMTCVRLIGSTETLKRRVRNREVGSGSDDQIERAMRQLTELASVPSDSSVRILATDGRTPLDVATEVAALWPPDRGAI